jgi:hypothetical protein
MLLTNTIQNVTTNVQIILDCVADTLRVRPVASAYVAAAAMRSMHAPGSYWQTCLPQKPSGLHNAGRKPGSERGPRFGMSVDIFRCFHLSSCCPHAG